MWRIQRVLHNYSELLLHSVYETAFQNYPSNGIIFTVLALSVLTRICDAVSISWLLCESTCTAKAGQPCSWCSLPGAGAWLLVQLSLDSWPRLWNCARACGAQHYINKQDGNLAQSQFCWNSYFTFKLSMNPSDNNPLMYRVKLFIGAKVPCVFCF